MRNSDLFKKSKMVLVILISLAVFWGNMSCVNYQESNGKVTPSPKPSSCSTTPLPSDIDGEWKSLTQVARDLNLIVEAGYTKVCLFDLKDIQYYPDSEDYVALLKDYVYEGIEIEIFVQDVEPCQRNLDFILDLGVSTVILYEQELWDLFKDQNVRIYWWSGTVYPSNHLERPQYRDWPDLRDEEVRQEIAAWAVQVPVAVDGLVLDYIRWNRVGAGRTADQVTDLVKRIREQYGGHTLSAAVYPYLGASPSYGGASSVGQAWDTWLELDLLDFVYPMAYDSESLPAYIEEWENYDQFQIIPCLSIVDY